MADAHASTAPAPGVSNLVLGVGETDAERNLAWYSPVGQAHTVELARTDEIVAGEFPADATVVEPDASGLSVIPGKDYHHATLTGLEPATSYSYRVGSEAAGWSDTFEFATDASADFEYLVIGDAQIGSSGDPQRDAEAWAATLDVAEDMFPGANLLVSAGDQVDSSANEIQYEGFTSPEQLGSLALATTIGNHDVSARATYEQHFNLAGLDTDTRDNSFVWNDTLFIVINTNLRDTAAHKAFMEQAIAQAGEVDNKVVVMHHSIYSTASHTNDSDIIERRAEYPAVFTELGIDYVLSGHDHVYTRTHLMSDGEPVSGGRPATLTPQAGQWLYLTLNSSSGSKFYGVLDQEFGYASVINQERVPNFTHVAVTECRTDFTTYRPADRTVVDTVGIANVKAAPVIEAGDVTIAASDVAGFDESEGVAVVDACEELTAEVSGEVGSEPGTYELTYSVVDAYGNEAEATRSVTVTADATTEPTATTTATATPTPTATPSATAPASPKPAPSASTAPKPPAGDLYQTPGLHRSGGRDWMTVCEPYSRTTRCFTYIWATQIHEQDGKFVEGRGWAFNNLTYVASPKALWASNPLGNTGSWTAADGRKWRTECNTPRVGGNGCRSWAQARIVERDPAGGYRFVTTEVFNNIVRFSS
nr:fibronectin type III domain-containing protein [Tessaracoccus sp. OS52]